MIINSSVTDTLTDTLIDGTLNTLSNIGSAVSGDDPKLTSSLLSAAIFGSVGILVNKTLDSFGLPIPTVPFVITSAVSMANATIPNFINSAVSSVRTFIPACNGVTDILVNSFHDNCLSKDTMQTGINVIGTALNTLSDASNVITPKLSMMAESTAKFAVDNSSLLIGGMFYTAGTGLIISGSRDAFFLSRDIYSLAYDFIGIDEPLSKPRTLEELFEDERAKVAEERTKKLEEGILPAERQETEKWYKEKMESLERIEKEMKAAAQKKAEAEALERKARLSTLAKNAVSKISLGALSIFIGYNSDKASFAAFKTIIMGGGQR